MQSKQRKQKIEINLKYKILIIIISYNIKLNEIVYKIIRTQ